MKIIGLITVSLIALLLFTGIVSAELNELNFGDKTSIVDTTVFTYKYPQYCYGSKMMRIADITKYSGVSKIVSVTDGLNQVYSGGSWSYYTSISEVSTTFTLKHGVTLIGYGTVTSYRSFDQYNPISVTEVYEFDYWNIGTLTGNIYLDLAYGDNGYVMKPGHKAGSVTTTPVNGYFYLMGAVGWYHPQTTTVTQNYDFQQTIAYYYDGDADHVTLTAYRNDAWSLIEYIRVSDDVTLYTGSGTTDFTYTSFLDNSSLYVDVTNSRGSYWRNIIPSDYRYEPSLPESGAIIKDISELEFNVTPYRNYIENTSVFGNVTIVYLDYIDGIRNEIFGFASEVVNTLMSPIDLINEKLAVAIVAFDNTLPDIMDTLGVITLPVSSIINAIPGKLMSFFIFVLLLDVFKVFISWGM